MDSNAHTLVLDIGKSNAKLVLFNAEGDVLARRAQANAPVEVDGYTALGTETSTTPSPGEIPRPSSSVVGQSLPSSTC